MYHALRALILQKKYQKKYEKYTVKFLLLAVALHQLLLYGRCGRCGHSNQTLHMTKTKNANQKPRGEFYVGKIKNQKLSEKKVRIVSSRVNCVFPHVELEAERSELFSRIRRIRCLSFRSCQRLALRELLPKRRLEKFQKTFQKHFVKIFRPSWKQKISKPPPQSQSQEVCWLSNNKTTKTTSTTSTTSWRLLEDLEWAEKPEKHLLALNPVFNRFGLKLQSAKLIHPGKQSFKVCQEYSKQWFNFVQHPKKT